MADEASQQCSYNNESEDGPQAVAAQRCDGFENVGVLLQVGHSALQEVHANQQQSQSDDGLSDGFQFVAFGEEEEEADGGQQHGEGEAARPFAEAEESYDPGCCRGADIGAHDDRHGTRKGEETGVDEAHHHHCGGRRRLDDCRYAGAGEDAAYGVGGDFAEDGAHAASSRFLQAFAHLLHGIEKDGQGPDEIDGNCQNVSNVHIVYSCCFRRQKYTMIVTKRLRNG